MNFGVTELLIVAGIVVLLFGATRIPKLAKSLGQASKEFKTGAAEAGEDPAATAGSEADEKVTMTKAELDALLDERDARIRKDGPAS